MSARAYLDWNATAPLRPEARQAMGEAMDVLGNPSSVHAEGRAAKSLLESCRARVAAALGADVEEVIFTSGATEAASIALDGRGLKGAEIEHDAVLARIDPVLPVAPDGRVTPADPAAACLQWANSETGVIQDLPDGLAVSDLTQGVGKLPFAFGWSGIGAGLVSGHKLGAPKGVGVLLLKGGTDPARPVAGGGQERGRRGGTENLIGIAGMAAALEASVADLGRGVWERVAQLRDILEKALEAEASDTIFVGNTASRLPNTSCIATPGWKGETQVMQMDLAGFAISAGSACSSGKVRASRVLRAMGLPDEAAGSAVRVSIGPATSEEDILRFAQAWLSSHRKFRARAA
ncbi:aminotransferase [Brevirhabdus pacifica]|uniref:Cysteine desulfurase n=1 Tax=Brevirhabdus pacifica TaxID=1267768 RepID=A0A1U7DFS9_9RHOB|nr:aminotransferase class V-fold PLP-dependent enzyme [Brevirhabdus pacifica]APX88738.1 aminotransferase [Brevirhabdus pacifica]OWU79995.1 aminotransferase [Loktanella sp. 22II-4b]PJJ86741.1 cysteine desulfurase [Brevirhabdus pacifica]